VRAFVGLAVPGAQRAALEGHLAECVRRAPAYRWVEPEALHLTLRFLGGVEPDVLARVAEGLAAIRTAPFRVALGGRGTFGSRSAPRVVWLGLTEGAEACAGLAGAVERACVAAGMEPETRPFRAHLTLGRARREGERLAPLPEPPALAPWTASELVLFESRLRQQPRYVALERYPLRAG
jgi:RNA 2',3'-cyclic 3'-phosphodiesterase